MDGISRPGRTAVRAGICTLIVGAATMFVTGQAHADASDDSFLGEVHQSTRQLELDDQQLITLGNSVCGVLYGTMTTNPFATHPGSTLSQQEADAVALAAVRYYCPSAVDGQSPDATGRPPEANDYHPDDGSPGTDSWVMNEMNKVNERNLDTARGW